MKLAVRHLLIIIILVSASLLADPNDKRSTIINVKDYGALGNGINDDSAAIRAAIAALPPSNAKLYFPAGEYRCSTIVITAKKHLTICGDGWPSSIIKSNKISEAGDGRGPTIGAQVLNIDAACCDIEVYGLTFDGSCDYRKPGQQAVIIDSDNTTFRNNYTINSGEYANSFGRNNARKMDNLIVTDNRIGLNWADGINLNNVNNALVANNMVDGANDDLIAVSDSNNVAINGNFLRSRIDLPSKVGRGIAILDGSKNIHASSNYIEQVKQYGLYIVTENANAARPANIDFYNTTLRNVAINSGDAVYVFRADNVTLVNTNVYNPGQGDCILIGDWTNLTIIGGILTQTKNQYCRGIHALENSGLSPKWSNLIIKNVQINMLGASTNEAIYLSPHDSVMMDTILITGVSAKTAADNNYIFVDPGNCEKSLNILNNISLD